MGSGDSLVVIGIDTGGTFTDAVAFDARERRVLAKGKARTTKSDLSIGILEALGELPDRYVRRACRVSLSTTLATNACVEEKGCRAKLVLIGTTGEVLDRIGSRAAYGFHPSDVLCLDTRSSFDGSVVDEPSWDDVVRDHGAWLSDAEAIGVCERGATRNGAVCERGAREAFASAFGVPIVMANDLASNINMMERGATALLNARLLPVIDEFAASMRRALDARNVHADIGIVRSDGTLMNLSAAQSCPVETIVSGPAASVLGARGLAESENCLVIDMGGTTTDVSIVENGCAVVSDRTRIGSWRTQVEGVFVETFGLGGDSRVLVKDGSIVLAERRAEPLCVALARWPELRGDLARLAEGKRSPTLPFYEILYLAREPKAGISYTDAERRLIDELRRAPVFVGDTSRIDCYALRSERLEAEGVVMRCGFTPTDAMHIVGDFSSYDVEASRLAARCLCRGVGLPESDEGVLAFARTVYGLVEKKLFERISCILLRHRYPHAFEADEGEAVRRIAADVWDHFASGESDGIVEAALRTDATLVGVGAPTGIFLPRVARAIGAACVVPADADVANAVGAAMSSVGARAEAKVVPLYNASGIIGYTVHTDDRRTSTRDKGEAILLAQDGARAAAERMARRRGARGELEFEATVKDISSGTADGKGLYLGTDIAVTAYAKGLL